MRYLYEHLTIEDHVELGNKLKAAWLVALRVRGAFPKAHRAYRAAWRTEKALLSLKCALDDEVCRLVRQEQDPRHLTTQVYYGSPFVKDATCDDAHDAFAGWTQMERTR
jgi:hypothetical protein